MLRQVGLAHDVATAVAHHIAELQARRPVDGRRLAARAGQIERKADRIAFEARKEAARLNAGPLIQQLVDRVEEAVDELEQAAFIASLAPAGMATSATEAAASGLAAAVEVPEGRRADTEDALNAVVRLIDAEHAADSREREVTARVFAGGFDVATSLSVLELARAIERATDRLAGFGHLLRRHIMTDLAA